MRDRPEKKLRRIHTGKATQIEDDLESPVSVVETPFVSNLEDNLGDVTGVDSPFERYYADQAADSASNDPLSDESIMANVQFSLEDDLSTFPPPEVFNAYPPEVQKKFLEWTDRDVRARREDVSHRQDALLRARLSRDSMRITIPVAIIILGILCAAITGVLTKSPVISIAFLVIPVIVTIALIVQTTRSGPGR